MLKCIVDDLISGVQTAKSVEADVYVKSWLQTKAIAWLMMQEPGKSILKNTTMELFGSVCAML